MKSISKIISSGASGAETAALDVAIQLKIPFGGFTQNNTMMPPHRLTRRYKLSEKQFINSGSKDKANVQIADATLIFSHGDLGKNLAHIEAYAFSIERPCFHIDLDELEPLQAAFYISIWNDRHSPESLFVTGSAEEEDERIYQATYDTLFSFLMLGKEEYPEQEQPSGVKKPLPKTVEEAVVHLNELLPLKDKVTIANLSADEVAELNLSLGNFIRNCFGLWSGNDHLMWSCSKEAGKQIVHEDEASAVILSRLALELGKTHKLRSL